MKVLFLLPFIALPFWVKFVADTAIAHDWDFILLFFVLTAPVWLSLAVLSLIVKI